MVGIPLRASSSTPIKCMRQAALSQSGALAAWARAHVFSARFRGRKAQASDTGEKAICKRPLQGRDGRGITFGKGVMQGRGVSELGNLLRSARMRRCYCARLSL